MAESRTMARPYARAVFEIAREDDALAAWSDALAALAAVVANDDVAAVMDHPDVSEDALARAVIGIIEADLPARANNVVRLLVANGRLSLAPEIAEQYEALRAQAERRVDVTVTSATPFSEPQQKALAEALESRLDANVRLSFEQDAEIIGGAVVRAGDLVIDRSVRSQLTRMQQRLAQ